MASILNLPDDNIGDIQSFTDPYQAKTNSCICKYLSKGFIKIHRQHVEDTLGYRKQLFSKYVPPYIQNKFLGKNTCPPQMPGQVLLDDLRVMQLMYHVDRYLNPNSQLMNRIQILLRLVDYIRK